MEKNICEFCLEKFDDKNKLDYHKESSTYCLRYRNITFNCIKCNFSTIGIQNIDNHVSTCSDIKNKDNLEITLSRIEEKLNFLLQNNNNKSNKKIKNVISDDEDDEQIIIKKNSPTSKKNSPNSPNTPKNKKQTYKTFKNNIKLIEEITEEENNNKIEKIKNYYETLLNQYNLEDILQVFNESFQTIKQGRNYVKTLDIIKKTRTKLMCCVDYNHYIEILKNHITELEIIFKEKEYNEKKIMNTILKCLNSIDVRLINYGNYHNTELVIDEMEKLKTSLTIFSIQKPYYDQFTYKEFFEKFYNYGSAIFTLKENIERYLFNCYGFNNIVYIPLDKSSEQDPFSFYILESVNKDNKIFWKMDCRLEDFSNTFIDNILPYLINLFRKLYFDVFRDNEYRKDYKSKNILTECDCEQLLENIYKLANQKDFCNFLRNLIKNKATYFPTENDKCNLLGDDNMQKKRFASNKETSDNIINIIKRLFDGISSEDAVDFYRKDV